MVETQFPKFKWGTISEQNSGHTQNEWGVKKGRQKTIIAYSLVWEKIIV
jgi:hypothetical protein